MKEKVLSKLKEKFEGVSDAILGRFASKIAATLNDESEVDTAIGKVTIQSLLESYGDSRANEAQQTAVKNYEQKHGLKDGEKVKSGKKGDDTAGDNKDVPEWAQALIESNNAMKSELASLKAQKTTDVRMAKIAELTKKLPDSFKKAYSRIQVDNLTDEEFDTLKDEIKSEVDGIVEEQRAKKAVFGIPRATATDDGGETPDASDKEVQDVVDSINI